MEAALVRIRLAEPASSQIADLGIWRSTSETRILGTRGDGHGLHPLRNFGSGSTSRAPPSANRCRYGSVMIDRFEASATTLRKLTKLETVFRT